MKLDLHISDFTWEGGPSQLASKLGEIARLAEDVGFDRISVMDHVWQIGHLGPPEHEMLEAYTTLGYLAAATQRAKLMTIVTASTYRSPGLLAKIVSGRGGQVDVSLSDVMLSQLNYRASAYLNDGTEPKRHPFGAHSYYVPAQLFSTADGYLALSRL